MPLITTLHGGDDEGPSPPSPPPPPPPSPTNPRDEIIARDKGSWEQALKEAAGGLDYSSELGDVIRQVSYAQNAGRNPSDFLNEAIAKLRRRAAPSGGGTPPPPPPPPPNPNDPRTATSSPQPLQYLPPFQFNDPYTKMYEEVLQEQLKSLRGQNEQMQQLMGFINKQFEELSTSKGYSPEELAVLQTQAWEPIEAQRRAAQQRILERASARGFGRDSGLIQGAQAEADTEFNKLRAAANRDVAIGSINERTNRLNQALNLAQLGVSIPDQRGMQGLNVANMLYQIPRTAMMDANTILGGSSPTGALSPFISLLGQQQGASRFNQLMNQQNNSALWAALGQLFGNMF